MRFVLRMRPVVVFTILLWIAGVSESQQTETPSLTEFPVPAWPKDGVIPPQLKDKYVFVDLAKNEYVLAYPENLGTESFEKDGPKALKIARYELLRNVEPAVLVTISPVNPSKYNYAYSVANGPAAKQSIDQWSLVLPVLARKDAIKKPAGWLAVVQNPRNFKLKNPDWIRGGVAAVWSFLKPEEVIPPGTAKTGFELESDLRPGFTIGYFRKAESIEAKVATSGNVPKAVQDQLDPLLSVEYNSKTLVTIGPKFEKVTDDRTVAADFVEGITALGRSGALDPNSEFVKDTISELKKIQPGAAASAVKLTAQARSPVETEILNALKISLRLN